MRREYPLKLTFNGRSIQRVLIDPHYEVRHRESIGDQLILDLLKLLDGEERLIEAITRSGFEIVRISPLYWEVRAYRLILTLPPIDQEEADYLGVINVFRIHERKRRMKE